MKVPRDGRARGVSVVLDIKSWELSKFCDIGGWELLVLKGDGSNVNKSIRRHICADYRGAGMVQTWKAARSFSRLFRKYYDGRGLEVVPASLPGSGALSFPVLYLVEYGMYVLRNDAHSAIG